MRFTLLPRPSIVGMDITRDYLYLVQLKKVKKHFLVEQTIVEPIPDEIWDDNQIKDWDKLTNLLSRVVAKTCMQRRRTVVSLPSHLVKVGTLIVPVGLKDAEIKNEIYDHVRCQWIETREQTTIDYMPLMQEDGYRKIQFVISSLTDIVHYRNAIQRSGLSLKIIEVDIYAIKRLLDASLSLVDIENLDSARPRGTMENQTQVILFVQSHEAFLLLIQHNYILFNQRFLFHAPLSLCSEIKQRLHSASTLFPIVDIQRFIVCGHKNNCDAIINTLPSQFNYKHLNLYLPLRFAAESDASFFATRSDNVAKACGAAMREMSWW